MKCMVHSDRLAGDCVCQLLGGSTEALTNDTIPRRACGANALDYKPIPGPCYYKPAKVNGPLTTIPKTNTLVNQLVSVLYPFSVSSLGRFNPLTTVAVTATAFRTVTRNHVQRVQNPPPLNVAQPLIPALSQSTLFTQPGNECVWLVTARQAISPLHRRGKHV